MQTHYKLVGPKKCSSEQLQAYLLDAAHILVHDDPDGLERIANWFRHIGIELKPSPYKTPLKNEVKTISSGEKMECVG